MSKKPLEIDMIAGSQLRDTQGEMLDVAGADITVLTSGAGRLNDNHGKGFHNSIGRVTYAKKIFKAEDCDDDRQKYYWNQVKAPYIYAKGELYNNEEHPNAKAAAAILRSIHIKDTPLKIKASVEGGTVARGITDPSILAKTKIHSVALTFVPANKATLVEPISLDKSSIDQEADMALIKSVMHLAQTNIPSFRHITRDAQATKISNNFNKIHDIARKAGINVKSLPITPEELIKNAIEQKITNNVSAISELIKALSAGYGGAGAPTSMTGGAVLQSEAVSSPGFKYITCRDCGKEQIYATHQVKCRDCNKGFSMESLYKLMKK